jgi:transcriptional regulator with XRE-family HTH domain
MKRVRNVGGMGRQLVAANVTRLRKERSMSQELLGEYAGMHRTFISQLERQVTNVTIDNLERIAGSLDVQLFELFMPVERSQRSSSSE